MITRHDGPLIAGDLDRVFDPLIDWSLPAVASSCVDWMCAEEQTPTMNSRAWMMSSSPIERLLSNYLNPSLSKFLRILVETSSMIYHWGSDVIFPCYNLSDLWDIRSFAGSQVLGKLEALLSNTSSAKASLNTTIAVFLVVFNATIAIVYTDPRYDRNKVRLSPISLPQGH